MRSFRSILVFLPLLALLLTGATFRTDDDFDHDAIRYRTTVANDQISVLQKQLDTGKAKLLFDSKFGYLTSVLHLLKIPASSQMLVFSKTSFQRDLISPEHPRALYFNDNTYIGWVQYGSVLEIATTDSQLGAVFYTLSQSETEKPKFERQTYDCLQCHSSSMTEGVPGLMMRSMYTRRDGQPEYGAGSYVSTDQSPIDQRWGGWYVTGQHGKMRHMGNSFAKGAGSVVTLDTDKGANQRDLKRFLDTSSFLTNHSDIVALMIAEHQTRMHTLITKANYHTRMALDYEVNLNKELSRPLSYRSDSTLSRTKSVCEPLLQAMLFCGEAKLISAVNGTTGFASSFSKAGPFDGEHRSLREFDLKTRLFKHPCSYLIYSEQFQQLPLLAKDYLYKRLAKVLSGADQSKEFAHLSSSDRLAILEILNDTLPEFRQWNLSNTK